MKLLPELRFPEFEGNVWEQKKLGELGCFLGGGTPSKSNPEFWVGELPWISSSDLNEDDIHSISITRYINSNALKETATKLIPIASVIFVSRVGVGKLAINKREVCTSQDFTSFIPESIGSYFIGYYFSSNKNLLQSMNQGTSIKGFSKSDLENFMLPYPTNPLEQQKIASCLSSLDELLAAHKDKLDALRIHKKGLMQNLFPHPSASSGTGRNVPQLRFAEFEEDGEWERVVLDKISHKIMVGIASAATHAYRKSGIILFRNQNIKEGYLDDRDILYIDEEYEKAHKNKRLKGGDLLTARTGYPGTTCMVPAKYEGSQSFTTLITRPNNKFIDSSFLCFYLNSETGQAFFNSTKIGGGQKNVNAGSLSEMPIPHPSQKEQQKIASCLSALDELITAQTEKIEELQAHKKGLMQGLFPKIEG